MSRVESNPSQRNMSDVVKSSVLGRGFGYSFEKCLSAVDGNQYARCIGVHFNGGSHEAISARRCPSVGEGHHSDLLQLKQTIRLCWSENDLLGVGVVVRLPMGAQCVDNIHINVGHGLKCMRDGNHCLASRSKFMG